MQPPAEKAAVKSRGRHWALHQHSGGQLWLGRCCPPHHRQGKGVLMGRTGSCPAFQLRPSLFRQQVAQETQGKAILYEKKRC